MFEGQRLFMGFHDSYAFWMGSFQFWHFALLEFFLQSGLPSFSPERGHVIEKHVLIGCKNDVLEVEHLKFYGR